MDIQGAQFNVGASDLYVQVSLCGGATIPLSSNGLTFSVDVLFQSSGGLSVLGTTVPAAGLRT